MAVWPERWHDASPPGASFGKSARRQLGRCEVSVFEMREHFGPGWRMYFVQRGGLLIVMLGGGDKSTQPADIPKAIKLAATLEE